MKDITLFLINSLLVLFSSFTLSYQLLSRLGSQPNLIIDDARDRPSKRHPFHFQRGVSSTSQIYEPASTPPIPYRLPPAGQPSIPPADPTPGTPVITPPVPYTPPAPGQSSVIDLSQWEYLISFRPPIHIQEETLRYQKYGLKLWYKNAYTNWYVQRIEDAVGSVNLDYYPVLVRRMPKENGIEQTPASLLLSIRRSINTYISDGYTSFEPYNPSWAKACGSEIPSEALGCYFFINIILRFTGGIARDDGTVVISEITPQYWIFTTVFAVGHRGSMLNGGSSMHPITGNRQFGYKSVPEGYIFYTRGVDRVSDSARLPGSNIAEIIKAGAFSSGDRLWRSFQKSLAERVRQNGGEAIALEPTQLIESWDYSVKRYHHPSVHWIDSLPTGQSYPYADTVDSVKH